MSLPITILGGYLGAGKTTLINRLLATQNPSRLAVFVNDFGDVNIDAALIETESDNVVSLTNGCVCCSIGDDLGKALFDLLESDQPTDHIIIEASGAADPARIGGYAGGDTRLGHPTIITIADVETIEGRAKDKFVGKLVKRQLSAAHLIALSKTDLASPEKTMETSGWITALAPKVPVVDSADLHEFLISAPSVSPSLAEADNLPQFETFTFETSRLMDQPRLERAMNELPEAIWRAKGFVCFSDGTRGLVQKVGNRTQITHTTAVEEPRSVLVFISTPSGAESDEILSKMHSCCEN